MATVSSRLVISKGRMLKRYSVLPTALTVPNPVASCSTARSRTRPVYALRATHDHARRQDPEEDGFGHPSAPHERVEVGAELLDVALRRHGGAISERADRLHLHLPGDLVDVIDVLLLAAPRANLVQ